MSAIVSALDNFTQKNFGENGHVQYGWSNNVHELFTQFYFQLVRTKNFSDLVDQLQRILHTMKGKESSVEFANLFKLIAHTRDIVGGKGERDLTFMQLIVWNKCGYVDESFHAFSKILDMGDEHPYGSWADVQHLYKYCKKYNILHEKAPSSLIDFACKSMVTQLILDWEKYMNWEKNGKTGNCSVSLVARWFPREKSSCKVIFKRAANMWGTNECKIGSDEAPFYHSLAPWTWLATADTSERARKAKLKVFIHVTKMITTLNRHLDTPQVKFCNKEWRNLNFNNITTQTLRKNKLAIRNQIKKGGKVVEREHKSFETKADRVECAKNYENHIAAAKSGDATKKIHGKRCNTYELVREAVKGDDNETTNLQWESNSTNNGALGDMIAMVDTSGSMEVDECIPLYNAIGMGIRISEKTTPAFRNRVMTFNSQPRWITLNENSTFCDKVRVLKGDNTWGMDTNFYAALDMILQTCSQNKIPASEVKKMVLVVLSDMQINQRWYGEQGNADTMYTAIEKMYHKCGLEAVGEPYTPPHIVFFNLRKTNGFPVLSTQKNTTMMSGYSANLLNAFCDKGIDALSEFSPYKMVHEILNNERYDSMNPSTISREV